MPDSKGKPLPGEWWEMRGGGRAYVAALLPDTSPIASSPHSQLTGWLNEHQRVAAGSWSINGEWVTTSPSKQDLVKHLPDCDSWDWQPPDWVELDPVNYGWHVLRRNVDWCKNNDGGKFNPAIVNGLAGEEISAWCRQYTFRCLRKDLPQKPPEPVKQKLQLEYGKRYVKRNGTISGVLKKNEGSFRGTHPFCDSGTTHHYTYTNTGRVRLSETESEYDLIAEYIEPTTATSGGPYVSIEVHQKVVAERDALLARMREIEAKAKFFESVM